MDAMTRFATGIHNVDAQHRIILGFIAHFEKAYAQQAPWSDLYLLLLRARTFVEYHCCVEDTLMDAFDLPDAAMHRARNRCMLEQLSILQRRLHRANTRDIILSRTCHLLVDHVRQSRRQFSAIELDRWPA